MSKELSNININMKVSWVNKKTINISSVVESINSCIETKHMTNNGMNVVQLQSDIKNMFHLEKDKEVLMTCNGAAGIQALIGGFNIHFNRKLKWAVQAFTFPCSNQGLLIDSIIMDIDHNMGPNIIELEEKKDSYDGIIVTNCFGCSTNISMYEKFCKENNKLLLFDNAAAPMTTYNNTNHLNYGDGCMVSLHHTKPIGFGEGGFIVFNKIYSESMKKAICFGYTDTNKTIYDMYSGNHKMSEIACIYIKEYLKNLDNIYSYHKKMLSYFIEKIKDIKDIKLFTNYSNYNESLCATIPILFNKQVNTTIFLENGIEAKKYYYPLNNSKNSMAIYNMIICLPLNMDINESIIDHYIMIIKRLL
jgi:dTDP-4-amino-4,6-dideoxygalactose transaminase